MPFDTYLKIAGVDGEATAKGHEGQMEIYSFSWGASNPTTIGPGTSGSGAGRVSISSFNIMKKSDKSSPKLFLACCKGDHYDTAEVTLRKAGGTQSPYLKYKFTQVFVDSIQWSGSSGGDDTPTESVSFSFAKVEIEYQQQDAKGPVGKPVNAAWDLTTVEST